jgi:hypothetical protein
MSHLETPAYSYAWRIKKSPVMERAMKTAKISSVSILGDGLNL